MVILGSNISKPMMAFIAVFGIVLLALAVVVFIPAWILKAVLRRFTGDGLGLKVAVGAVAALAVWWWVDGYRAGTSTFGAFWLFCVALCAAPRWPARPTFMGGPPPSPPSDDGPNPKIIEI